MFDEKLEVIEILVPRYVVVNELGTQRSPEFETRKEAEIRQLSMQFANRKEELHAPR